MTPEFAHISAGHHPDPALSMSLHADAYTDPKWHDIDQWPIFGRSWQWLCHVEPPADAGRLRDGDGGRCPYHA